MRPQTLDIINTLANPVASPVAFWTSAPSVHSPYPRTDAPWRAMGWATGESLPSLHRPKACGHEAIDHAKLWMRYSVHAGLTAGLRCAVPPVVTHLAYQRAAQAGTNFAGCLGAAVGACAVSCKQTALGIVVNTLQMAFGFTIVTLCIGLSAYYFAQAALEIWLPPRLVVAR